MRFLARKQILEKFSVCRTTLYLWEKDKGFPKPVVIAGTSGKRWNEEEVDKWAIEQSEAA